MISLKRNTRGQPVKARGIRSRSSSIYNPGQTDNFRISRSKFTDFLNCQRCFYLDRAKGLTSPSTPGWALNDTTDILLKKEFDACREQGIPHRSFKQFGLNHVIPFKHPDLDKWRDALRRGLEHQIINTNITLSGAIDDIWLDQESDELIVVDYKSQSSRYPVNRHRYLSYSYHQDYKIQLDIYSYLLGHMGFPVSKTAYFYVCNGDRNGDSFNSQIKFTETLVPYKWNGEWIDEAIFEMIGVLNSNSLPPSNPACEKCAYSYQRAIMQFDRGD